jgi:hypothetical protein
LEDLLEECFAQFECDLDLDILHEQADALLDFNHEIRIENGEAIEISSLNPSSSTVEHLIVDNNEEEEKEEQVAPLENPNLPNNKEVNTETHSFFIVPLETNHEPKVLAPQCLEESSYVKIFKDLCTQAHKCRKHRPKKILQSKQVGYLRW